jgi:hypothetical protein
MIPVQTVREPEDFDVKVRAKGNRWLAKNPRTRKRPPSYWSDFTPILAKGFGNLCGYAAMYVPNGGTVDHYLSFKNRPDLAYEWTNYRFASTDWNSIKKNADEQILDPYEIGEGWFEILLPSLIMRTTNAVPARLREKAEYTLDRLKLRDGVKIIRWRQAWYEMYESRELNLDGLRHVAPLLADAVDRELTRNRVVTLADTGL